MTGLVSESGPIGLTDRERNSVSGVGTLPFRGNMHFRLVGFMLLATSGFRLPHKLLHFLLRKEVIQPHLPIRLPCYDLTPIINPTFGSALLAVTLLTSGVADSHGLTGGVYKTRERIHRGMLIRDY